MGDAQKLRSGVVDKLQHVFAVEGEQRRMHHLENARQQSCGFERAHALFLQQVGEGIDLRRQFAESIRVFRAARAKRVVAFAQRRDHVGERLQRAASGSR